MSTVLDIVEKTVQSYPDKTAVVDPKESRSWQEVYEESQRIAEVILQRVGCKTSGYPVAVFSEKKVALLTSILGINFAGGFYVYINPEQPVERIRKILEVLEPKLMLVDDELEDIWNRCDESVDKMLFSEVIKAHPSCEKINAIRPHINRDTPMYGVFTSGSTGTPKCIVISHGAALDFIGHFTERFSFSYEDVIGNQAPFDFDVSIKDIVTAYMTGATLVLIPREYFSTPPRLLDYLCEHHVTSLTWAVSALCLISGLKGFSYRVPTEIQRVMFSGEVMPLKQLHIWQAHLPKTTFVNLYGPSEITCNCTYYVLPKEELPEAALPLGQAFSGRQVFLLDEHGQRVTTKNTPGEICVTGESLATGYYHNEAQTAAHFVLYKDETGEMQRMYKTGDMAMYKEDGELYFCGRKDFQIKHMGHRIELEEVERGIGAISGVERSICSYDSKRQRITAYYTGSVEKKALHLCLKEKLPVYMVPNRFCHVKEFVLNKNGKVDRSRLEQLEEVL